MSNSRAPFILNPLDAYCFFADYNFLQTIAGKDPAHKRDELIDSLCKQARVRMTGTCDLGAILALAAQDPIEKLPLKGHRFVLLSNFVQQIRDKNISFSEGTPVLLNQSWTDFYPAEVSDEEMMQHADMFPSRTGSFERHCERGNRWSRLICYAVEQRLNPKAPKITAYDGFGAGVRAKQDLFEIAHPQRRPQMA